MLRLAFLGLLALFSLSIWSQPSVQEPIVDTPSASELLKSSTVDLDLSKLQDRIKQEKLSVLKAKIDKSNVNAPKKIENEEFIARLNFGLDKLDDFLVKTGDEREIVATDSPAIGLTKIMLLPNNRYKVVGKKRNEPQTLPVDDGRYAYRILSKHKAELVFVPEVGPQKGTAYKVILDFRKLNRGSLDTELFKNLKDTVKIPVDFHQLMYITDQQGLFELKPRDQ